MSGERTAQGTSAPLSGDAFRLSHGPYAADIASVGATLRSLTHQGRDLVVPFREDEVRPSYRGAVLAPWPNRVVDGEYSFRGVDYTLSLTEPERHHALHGLASWLQFEPVESSPERVVLAATVPAQMGYPFRIALEVTYELSDQGLRWEVAATNTGPSDAPFGTGPHPYLVAGEGRVDDWTLELPASRVLTVTPDRLIPVELVEVTGSADEFDFRSERPVEHRFLDHAYTGVVFDESGTATARVRAADGSGVAITWDAASPWVQVHTGDKPKEPEVSRLGLAIEPMTCPPDAFNSGTDLIVLAPGETAAAGWRISALPAR